MKLILENIGLTRTNSGIGSELCLPGKYIFNIPDKSCIVSSENFVEPIEVSLSVLKKLRGNFLEPSVITELLNCVEREKDCSIEIIYGGITNTYSKISDSDGSIYSQAIIDSEDKLVDLKTNTFFSGFTTDIIEIFRPNLIFYSTTSLFEVISYYKSRGFYIPDIVDQLNHFFRDKLDEDMVFKINSHNLVTITHNGLEMTLSQLGSGYAKVVMMLPMLEYLKENKGLVYFPMFSDSFHPFLLRTLVDHYLKNTVGTIIAEINTNLLVLDGVDVERLNIDELYSREL